MRLFEGDVDCTNLQMGRKRGPFKLSCSQFHVPSYEAAWEEHPWRSLIAPHNMRHWRSILLRNHGPEKLIFQTSWNNSQLSCRCSDVQSQLPALVAHDVREHLWVMSTCKAATPEVSPSQNPRKPSETFRPWAKLPWMTPSSLHLCHFKSHQPKSTSAHFMVRETFTTPGVGSSMNCGRYSPL